MKHKQVVGNHYAKMNIQPLDFIEANGLGFNVGNIIKYVCRYKNKNGIEDLEKAAHYLERLINLEKRLAASEHQEHINFKHDYSISDEEEEAWREAEKRIDAIGQNGNTGEHYVPAWVSEVLENAKLPEWTNRLRLYRNGDVWAFGKGNENEVVFHSSYKPTVINPQDKYEFQNELWERAV